MTREIPGTFYKYKKENLEKWFDVILPWNFGDDSLKEKARYGCGRVDRHDKVLNRVLPDVCHDFLNMVHDQPGDVVNRWPYIVAQVVAQQHHTTFS